MTLRPHQLPMICMLLLVALAVCPTVGWNYTALHVADSCAGEVPQEAVLNPMTISFSEESCHDAPLIDGLVQEAPGRLGRMSGSQEEHDKGLTIKSGDVITLSGDFDNGGIKGWSETAKNVRLVVMTNMGPTTDRAIRAFLIADNALPVAGLNRGGDLPLRSELPTILEYIPGSAVACIQQQDATERHVVTQKVCGRDSLGQAKTVIQLGDEWTDDNVLHIFDIPPGWVNSGFTFAGVRVRSPSAVPAPYRVMGK